MIETGTLLQNRYLIERQIGAGGMGAVYLGIDQRFDSQVAIKKTFFTDDELREAFEREARLLNNLHHPVLPHVSDFFTEGNNHYLVMEYIEGDDLSEILKRGEKFETKTVLRWIDNLLEALDFLHSQTPSVVHRDIKPQNLKLTPRGDVVLLDFGLAKRHSADTTGVKSVFGYSRKYSPLEQIQGTGTDVRSDVFALGATAHHLLTGRAPLDTLARAASIIAGKSDPLALANEANADVPLGVAQVLQTAMALNPEMRFASAKAMRAALKYALNPELTTTPIVEEAIATVEENLQNLDSPETETFPALEAFAAAEENESLDEIQIFGEIENFDEVKSFEEVQNFDEVKSFDEIQNFDETENDVAVAAAVVTEPQQVRRTRIVLDEEAVLSKSLPPLSPEAMNAVIAAANAATQSQPRTSDRKMITVASIAAVMIWGGLGLWWATGGTTKSSEKPAAASIVNSTRTPVGALETASETGGEPEPISDSPRATTAAAAATTSSTTTVAPAPSSETKTAAKKTTRAEAQETPEKVAENRKAADSSAAATITARNAEKNARPVKETKESKTTTTQRAAASSPPAAPRKDNQTRAASSGAVRPRIVKPPAASNIERVLTGNSAARPEARRRAGEMSDAELEALRRRRAAEVQRINRQPVPPR